MVVIVVAVVIVVLVFIVVACVVVVVVVVRMATPTGTLAVLMLTVATSLRGIGRNLSNNDKTRPAAEWAPSDFPRVRLREARTDWMGLSSQRSVLQVPNYVAGDLR